MTIKNILNMIISFFKNILNKKKLFIKIGISLSLLASTVIAVSYLFNMIEKFGPSGETKEKTAIFVQFSLPVKIVKDKANGFHFFKITPAIEGSYEFPDERTIMFVPAEPLRPSASYSVTTDLAYIKSKKKIFGKTFTFFTAPFQLLKSSVFFTYHPVTGIEREAVAELDFNYPVEHAELLKFISLTIEGSPAVFRLENSVSAGRYYIKTAAPERENKTKEMSLMLREGLSCIDGVNPLAASKTIKLVVPKKDLLEIEKTEMHYAEGFSLVSILFNYPVASENLQNNISIIPELPFKIETEYRYAVIKADFLPNIEYKISIAKGLESRGKHVLSANYQRNIRIKDRDPEVKFADQASLVPLRGQLNLRYYAVNLDKVNFSVFKIFKNNLVPYLRSSHEKWLYGQEIDSFEKAITGELNVKNYNTINLSEYRKSQYTGLYQIEIRDKSSHYNRDNSTFLVSDIGMVSKRFGDDGASMLIYLKSIDTLQPLSGLTVKLLSENNQLMETQTANEKGMALFKNINSHPDGFKPFLLLAENGDDFSFHVIGHDEMDASRFSAWGQPYSPDQLTAFVTCERGLYRPGETVHITSILRKKNLSIPPSLPLFLDITDPKGNIVKNLQTDSGSGEMKYFKADFPVHALTGHYRIALRSARNLPPIGTANFKIEEFIPNKLEVNLRAVNSNLMPGETAKIEAEAKLLFGPPAADHKISASAQLVSQMFAPEKYRDYRFYDNTREYHSERIPLGEGRLDSFGKKEYQINIPDSITIPSALRIYWYAEVFDSSGRPVSASTFTAAHRYPFYLGIKTDNPSHTLERGDTLTLNLLSITPDGSQLAVSNLQLLVTRTSYYSIFRKGKRSTSRFISDSYKMIEVLDEIHIPGKTNYTLKLKEAGEYTILLGNENTHRTAYTFRVSDKGSVPDYNIESPETIKISSDKNFYLPGDTAKVTLNIPFDGMLILSAERENILHSESIPVTAGNITFPFLIDKSYFPNIYVCAVLLRKAVTGKEALPMTSMGIIPLTLNTDLIANKTTISAPQKISSDDGLTVHVQTVKPGSQVAIAVVDRGILDIDRFATPDPVSFFSQKIRLAVETFSLFKQILPDYPEERSVGGDMKSAMLKKEKHLNPIEARRVKSMALFSKIIKTDAEGKAAYRFELPKFNGEVRIMAWSVSEKNFGSAEARTTIADKIVVDAGLPRFLAPGDSFRMPLSVYNETGRPGSFTVEARCTGPISDPFTKEKFFVTNFDMAAGEQKKILLAMKAEDNAGKAVVVVKVSGNGEKGSFTEELAIRPEKTLRTTTASGRLSPGDKKSLTLPAAYIPYGQIVRLDASGSPVTAYLRTLEYLINYPHGCLEQTVSVLFPMLFLKDSGFLESRFNGKNEEALYFIQQGIEKLEAMQIADGRFVYWPGGNNVNDYASLYASHFLIEAKTRGFNVADETIKKIKMQIGMPKKNQGTLDRRAHNIPAGQRDVYRLYVQSLLGSADEESLNYLFSQEYKNLSAPDKMLLALTLQRIGKTEMAKQAVPAAVEYQSIRRLFGANFQSPIRTLAFELMCITEIFRNEAQIRKMLEDINKRMNSAGHFGSTQDNAWMLIAITAAAKYLEEKIQGSGILYITENTNTETIEKFSKAASASYENIRFNGQTITLSNGFTAGLYYTLTAEGTPSSAFNAKDDIPLKDGLTIKRRYLTTAGTPADLNQIKQGDLLVAELTLGLKNLSACDNVALVDLLPAGLEIENPRLDNNRSREGLDFQPYLSFAPQYLDIRDDRIIMAAGAFSADNVYSYTVRAVTAGEFVIPEAMAEAMYDPGIYARTTGEKILRVIPSR